MKLTTYLEYLVHKNLVTANLDVSKYVGIDFFFVGIYQREKLSFEGRIFQYMQF